MQQASRCYKRGDVSWLFGQEHGYYLAGFTADDVAEKILRALAYANRIWKHQGQTTDG
jgi:hypothetical protein